MQKKSSRVLAILVAAAVLLVTSPDLVAVIVTVQAIGTEAALLLLALQIRSLRDTMTWLATRSLTLAGSACTKLRPALHMLVCLSPKSEHPPVLRQLALLLYLEARCWRGPEA